MTDLSQERARELVTTLQIKNGGVTDEDREKVDSSILSLISSLRKQLGNSIEILAEELYTKPTRFVFELIQNAEDNQYTSARASGTSPYLKFSISRDKILIDSNEDGFSERNVEAICQVRISTKKGVRGYVGEKGIGFKSVFKVASKVHVQSGPFSFYFKYRGDNDDGMGMVTPFNNRHKDLPPDVRTRFTLTLKDDHQFESLVREFSDLPDTLLLFLTTLKRLQISINDGNELRETNYAYSSGEKTGKVLLVKKSNKDGQEKSHFFKHQKIVRNLPPEKARENIRDAEVVLAFPVDKNDVPVIEQQHAYAYLPLRKVGFPFLIQSDFLTQASREDVLHSVWNKRLLIGAAEVFVDAVVQFCENPTLQYLWPRYVPTETPLDLFWAQLRELIMSRLALVPVLRSWRTGTLKRIGQLKYIPSDACDDEGEPLFEDLADEIYLSYEYSEKEVSKLRFIGLKDISMIELWSRVQADLKSRSSRMKDSQTTFEWHTRCAQFLLSNATPSQNLRQLQGLEMLPLRDGSWTSVAAGSVFYPQIDRVNVPVDLGFRLLAPTPARHPTRKQLFDVIGVKRCDPTEVKKLIVRKYAKWNNVDLNSSVSHIRFLYYHCPANEQPVDKTMFLFDAERAPVYRTRVALGRLEMIVDDIYFDTPGAYNVRTLCAGRAGTRAFNIHIIHPAYLAEDYVRAFGGSRIPDDWLQKHAGVLHSPRLVDRNNPLELSYLFKWIVKNRTSSLLGILKTHWQTYENSMKQEIVAALQKVKLECSNGKDVCLPDAFIPLPNLLLVAKRLGVKDDIRFLKLPYENDKGSTKNWLFLQIFGVGVNEDLNFYLGALAAFKSRNRAAQIQHRSTLLKIYEAIEERAHVNDYSRLRAFFEKEMAVHSREKRKNSSHGYRWASPRQCVWKGPEFLTTTCTLAEDDDFNRSGRCRRLFTSILEIPDAGWSHITEQIAYEKGTLDFRKDPKAKSRISFMYHTLFSHVGDDSEWSIISEEFEKKSLIYVPPDQWRSPSECVWSENTYLPDRFPIASQYSGLKTFFVKNLKVSSPTLQSQIKELQILCSKQEVLAKFSEVSTLIKEINLWNPKSIDVQKLLDKKVLPVKDQHGRAALLQPRDAFAIGDRQKYNEMFAGKVAMLAIPLEEIRSVRNFLSALGLDNRYISRLVSEASEVRNAVVDDALSRDFRQRAYALVRCATHFESPGADNGGLELYHRLTHAVVYESDEVTSKVSLEIDGRVLATQTTSGNLHLESDHSGLRLYVPKDRSAREFCYFVQIPNRLGTHWSIASDAALKVIGEILNMTTGILDRVLLEAGIPEIPGLRLVDEDSSREGDQTDLESINQAFGPTHTRADSSSLAPTTPSISSFVATSSATSAFTPSRATTPEFQHRSVSLGRQAVSLVAPIDTTEKVVSQTEQYVSKYKRLLEHVVRAGRKSDIPVNYVFLQVLTAAEATGSDLDTDTIFGVRSQDAMAHDMRIGAAGELFAFETLQGHVNSFYRENWRSTIRHHVCVHEDYHDLAPWMGRETADIVYDDHSSKLTGLLIAYGYLPYQIWLNKTPTYYLEVKTTTGPPDTRFFMSKAQVRRMKEMRLDPNQASPEVYIILRVHDLTSDKIGMRILVDPATLEQQGKLLVEAESYTVLQKSGARRP